MKECLKANQKKQKVAYKFIGFSVPRPPGVRHGELSQKSWNQNFA